jgi:hypothetical protein
VINPELTAVRPVRDWDRGRRHCENGAEVEDTFCEAAKVGDLGRACQARDDRRACAESGARRRSGVVLVPSLFLVI